jgi:hypothetical protein
MKKLTVLLGLIILAGCSSNSSSDNKSPKVGPTSLKENTCLVSKVDGDFEDGAIKKEVRLIKEYLSTAIQKLYGEGEFLGDYSMGTATLSKDQLMAEAAAWKWSIAPAKDDNGAWTKLRVYKEILSSNDGDSYEVESKVFSYGDSIEVFDVDSKTKIECSIPKK